jgi:antitoxin (DNA-binding transcriptional repressor) of toxin-antitoxin stability system
MRDTVLNDAAPEEERLRDGIVLGAFLEWLAEAGSFADTALHILPDVLQDFSPDSCEALAEKLREMEKLLRKSPLTILDENGKSAFLGMESHGTIPDTPPSGSSDEMELISQESYDLPEAVVRVSVADAETRFGELIGRVANERIIVELQDGGRIVARLTPADAASRVDPIDYGWSVGDYDVFKLVEEFGGAADADY